jgi:hypothetical protein
LSRDSGPDVAWLKAIQKAAEPPTLSKPSKGEAIFMRTMLKSLAIGAVLAAGLASGANASIIHLYGTLSGANESPANASTATGLANVYWDTSALTMEVQIIYNGLSAPATGAHIHCCLASPFLMGSNVPVATPTPAFPGFTLGLLSGSYDGILDMTSAASYNNPSFITAHGGTVASEEAAFFAALISGETYLNIHDSVFPGGEIRTFLRVPEPGSLALMLGGLVLGAGFMLRKRRTART